MKCFDIETGKILQRRTVTQIPWPLDNHLVQKVEAWGKKGARAIKRGCIEFLNRKKEKFDWENDDLSDLEVVEEQPKVTDPGVADIPEEDEYDEDLGTDKNKKEKPSYVTRAVAARRAAGLDGESGPRAARGVRERADDVIEIDDDSVQMDVPEPPMTIKVEVEDIPEAADEESEPTSEALGWEQRKRVKRVPLSPRWKGQHHKAVGFVQAEEDSGSTATNSEDLILTAET